MTGMSRCNWDKCCTEHSTLSFQCRNHNNNRSPTHIDKLLFPCYSTSTHFTLSLFDKYNMLVGNKI